MASKTPVHFILGTHAIGDSSKDPVAAFDNAKDVQRLLDAFSSRGYTHLDTARNYSPHAPGSTEPRLGRAGAASQFTIHTKVRSGSPGDHEPVKLHLSIDGSLEDLQTATVETMFLHVPDRQTPFEVALGAMDEEFRQGKFRKLGLSNYSAAEVREILEICESKGYVKPSVFEGHYNPAVRGGEEELFPLLRKHNMAFFAYSPAAGGLFSNTTDKNSRWNGDFATGQLYRNVYGYGQPTLQATVEAIHEATGRHEIDSHAAALRWTAFHGALDGTYGDGVVFGVSKVEQVHKSLDALEAGPLPEDVAEAIGKVYAALGDGAPSYHL